jgi:hypothetical protein
MDTANDPFDPNDNLESERQLASEVIEVNSAIALVESNAASRVTITGLRFGEPVARQLRTAAVSRGVVLEAVGWPDDGGRVLLVRKSDD